MDDELRGLIRQVKRIDRDLQDLGEELDAVKAKIDTLKKPAAPATPPPTEKPAKEGRHDGDELYT